MVDTSSLTILGQKVREAQDHVETFPNPVPDGRMEISLKCTEFTSLCPMTGQPDYGTITIDYIPKEKIIESKSLKLFLWRYRNNGVFGEELVKDILDRLVKDVEPEFMRVHGDFAPRGGISITVSTFYQDLDSGALWEGMVSSGYTG